MRDEMKWKIRHKDSIVCLVFLTHAYFLFYFLRRNKLGRDFVCLYIFLQMMRRTQGTMFIFLYSLYFIHFYILSFLIFIFLQMMRRTQGTMCGRKEASNQPLHQPQVSSTFIQVIIIARRHICVIFYMSCICVVFVECVVFVMCLC